MDGLLKTDKEEATDGLSADSASLESGRLSERSLYYSGDSELSASLERIAYDNCITRIGLLIVSQDVFYPNGPDTPPKPFSQEFPGISTGSDGATLYKGKVVRDICSIFCQFVDVFTTVGRIDLLPETNFASVDKTFGSRTAAERRCNRISYSVVANYELRPNKPGWDRSLRQKLRHQVSDVIDASGVVPSITNATSVLTLLLLDKKKRSNQSNHYCITPEQVLDFI